MLSLSAVLYPKFSDPMWSPMACTIFPQSWPSLAIFHPYSLASEKDSPRMPAWCISFLGMHPTLTQVPPKPQVVPAGEGLTKSRHATFAPSFAASFAAARPPEPPPMTMRS